MMYHGAIAAVRCTKDASGTSTSTRHSLWTRKANVWLAKFHRGQNGVTLVGAASPVCASARASPAASATGTLDTLGM